jgi:hypothetical protein
MAIAIRYTKKFSTAIAIRYTKKFFNDYRYRSSSNSVSYWKR